MNLNFDFSKMVEETQLARLESERLGDLYGQIQEQKRNGELGFCKLPYQNEQLVPIVELANSLKQEFQAVVVIGIGGSDLGTRAVHRALNHQLYNLMGADKRTTPQLFFLGDTTDPVAIEEVLEVLNLAKTAFIVVSKSGNTVEQMSTFIYVRSKLIELLGEAHKANLVMITDEKTGNLREIAEREGYRSVVFPADVGGRFSVLSSASLLPLAIVGVDIYKLLEGARAMDAHDSENSGLENMPAKFALLQYLAYKEGRHTTIFMPYTYSLREVGFWFRQLWAESLGKKNTLDGRVVNVGPTPIASIGPTDQHSQVQLYMEGPVGKVFTFVTVKEPKRNMELPEAFSDLEGVIYLKGHSFNEILLAEQKSTAYALSEAGRPSSLIELPVLDEYTLGELLYFFEMATAYAGALFEINPFDQPGVEIGKQYMYGILGRPGFEDWKI